jgi:hypothetical protein
MTEPKATVSMRRQRDDEQEVLKAFQRCSHLCIHQLHKTVYMGYPDLMTTLSKLQRAGKIAKAPDPHLGKEDRQYAKLGKNGLTADQFVGGERLSPLIGLDERAMRGRVVMLQRMKRNLITEWHPVIDILLGDYERDLKRMERLRFGDDDPDADEPNVKWSNGESDD